ncbi:MAG: ankyrin repeat domain-containing protein [Candidatus Methylacidiphilales bacterium]|nr:ankyrin repeat domain-containing protein [Candidatus Methylacidiphilales bacterium]
MKLSPELKRLNGAVTVGKHADVRAIVAQHPDLVKDPRPLASAALYGHSVVVATLLELGADKDAVVPSHDNYRPLHRAIEHKGVTKRPGHLECLRLLLEAGADTELRGTWRGLTSLGLAGATGDEEMIALLRSHSPAPQQSIFIAALLADDAAVERYLVEDKTGGIAKSRDINGMTPLHCAAHCGLRDREIQKQLARICTLLLDAGADPDCCERIGPYHKLSVLHFAGRDNLAVAQTLLESGANANLGFGASLWHKPFPLAELFLKHGADVNLREDDTHASDDSADEKDTAESAESTEGAKPGLGTPLLHSRIHWNLPDMALWLLKHGANPNLTDAKGNTALHEAASRGINPKVVEALLEHGADPKARNAAGETPKDIAKRKGRKLSIPQ